MIKPISLPSPIFFFAVILYLLACADVVAIKAGSASIRYFYFLALSLPIFVPEVGRIDKLLFHRLLFLILCLVPSVILSGDPIRSLMYLVWVVVTFFSCYFMARLIWIAAERVDRAEPANRDRLFDLIVVAYRIQLIVAFALYFGGYHERPTFFYYEPSYFSISLSIYVATVLRNVQVGRPALFDFVLIVTYLVTSFSAAFLFVLCLIFLPFVLRRNFWRSMLILAACALLFGAYVAFVDDINTALIRYFLQGDIGFFDVLLRGGNRIGRIVVAYNAFLDNFWTGIGLGTFESYAEDSLLPSFIPSDAYMSIEGMPAVNIYLELAATAGIIGLAGFIAFVFPIVKHGMLSKFQSPLFSALFCMLLLLAFESNYLRPYFWICLFLSWMEIQARRKANE
jgi:O-antigen ligase